MGYFYCDKCGQRVEGPYDERAGEHFRVANPYECAEPGYTPGHLILGYLGKTEASPRLLRMFAGGLPPANILPEVNMYVDDALAALGSPLLTEEEFNRLAVALRQTCALPPVCPLRTSPDWPHSQWQKDDYRRRGVDFQPEAS